ncbi:bifunctional methylenetetrahydrofolate dehydrogenase/methenyltetrahydrofolate cyclohydrolase FolD [Rhizobium grahamii]|uniref:Bifunctional protein FolD n=1 Tax=Rhizobium grahamii TaxID=1120045 RepID=A0A5Q0C6W0_9HYPH|nr:MULTISPECIES: bifunctional methylenetetrahydrofolate dehydrogenase/methenyltetrahydrofolate cyclohydrolase FolD [Rhizobium]QFY59710.1 bifunctional methylenetetrahydrofolate dehydrogenase/methenyltetrahydrofolate cyclohydrolase FolD [Rhizobium grahamii]QRM51177.1 bifunctional methylenetetrahydrofolate dehydrogenase/methenyltetrahydrofolate cyclohydrolase FolD [Rhizobium sp. BG6]
MNDDKIISGKLAASVLIEDVKRETAALAARGIKPGLAVVMVGDDPASTVYVTSKGRMADDCGFLSRTYALDAKSNQAEVIELVKTLNDDDEIHGILIQLPLPAGLDAERVIQTVTPSKDVDGFSEINAGRLAIGSTGSTIVPCTPAGCALLIQQRLGADLSGKRAIVIGRSNIVGKPMAQLLLAANATVTIAHSRTADLPSLVRDADIVVAAVGRPEFVKGDWIKPGALIIDVGINRVSRGEKKALVGDVAYDECYAKASAITPVPGGVGPMTIAMLMKNTLEAARRIGR